MTQLIVNFTGFSRSDYPRLAQRLKDHLTPKTVKPLRSTQVYLENVRAQIPDQVSPYKFVTIKFPWHNAADYSFDLGVLPIEISDDLDHSKKIDVLDETYNGRYYVPFPPGSTRQHMVDIYGEEVNSCGNYPIQIRFHGDASDLSAHLYLLQGWAKALDESGDRSKFVDKIIEVGRNFQGVAPEYDSMLSGFARMKTEDFQEQILNAVNRLNYQMFQWAIGLSRCFLEFFRNPMEEFARLFSTEFTGHYDFKLLLSEPDLEEIGRFPTPKEEELIRKLASKAPDDLKFVRPSK